MIDYIFYLCVDVLAWIAKITGTSYEFINGNTPTVEIKTKSKRLRLNFFSNKKRNPKVNKINNIGILFPEKRIANKKTIKIKIKIISY